MPFPGREKKCAYRRRAQASCAGAAEGRELIFLARDLRLMSVPARTSPSLQLGVPKSLFQLKGRSSWPAFEVSRDGMRFLAVVPEALADERPLSVIVNWPSEVEK